MICDLAQIYGVLDHEALPPWKAAVLAKGLGPGSRIKQAVFAKLAEAPQAQTRSLEEFEAERERFLKERGLSHGGD